uniref:Uncharacterized protein n=1 Tax=Arundo donax TaxID=35708 RepID=A0A0A9BPN9_ARUDO
MRACLLASWHCFLTLSRRHRLCDGRLAGARARLGKGRAS